MFGERGGWVVGGGLCLKGAFYPAPAPHPPPPWDDCQLRPNPLLSAFHWSPTVVAPPAWLPNPLTNRQ